MPVLRMVFLTLAVLSAGCKEASSDEVSDSSEELVTATVRVAMPRQGSMPRLVTAYGEVASGTPFQQMIDVGAEGRWLSLDVASGDSVRQGQRLGLFALSPSARAAYAQARSAVEVAEQSLARARRLRVEGLTTDEHVDQAAKAVADAHGELGAFPSPIQRDGTVPVIAPADGTVAMLGATPGQTVPAHTALLSITPTSRQVVIVGVEPGAMAELAKGQEARLIAIEGNGTAAGQVVAIAGAIDPGTRLISVQIHPAQALMPGSAWRADIVSGQASGWRAPANALVEDHGAHWLYQVRNGRAYRVQVEVVFEQGGEVVLNGAIDAKAPMVIDGAPQLSDGMNVTAQGLAR